MELEAGMVLVSSGDGLEGPGESATEGRTGDAPVAGEANRPRGVDDGSETTPAKGGSAEAGSVMYPLSGSCLYPLPDHD